MSQPIALVVDDTPANRIFFERLLTVAGFEVISAETGVEALRCLETLDSIAIALIDMEMPQISGLELTLRLRQQSPETCIVVATMHDHRSLMLSAFERGCDIFVVKPHGFMDLLKRIQQEGVNNLRAQRPLLVDQFGIRPFDLAQS